MRCARSHQLSGKVRVLVRAERESGVPTGDDREPPREDHDELVLPIPQASRPAELLMGLIARQDLVFDPDKGVRNRAADRDALCGCG